MSVLIVGAGKSGRGYLARLLTESGVSVVLADSDKKLMRSFPGQYEVSFFSDREKTVIRPEYAGDMDDPVIQDYCKNAECIFVSVGMENLEDVGERIGGLISDRCQVILCENGNDACSAFLKKAGGEKRCKTVQAAVFCTTIEGEGYDIFSEDYSVLFCEKRGLSEKLKYDFMEYVDDFEVLMKRKLYTYNTLSAIISYAGACYGYDEFTDAAKDEDIISMTEEYLRELQEPICLEYGFTPADQEDFGRGAKRKFGDERIKDSIGRNARDPKRKLAEGERIMGPLRLIEKYGGNTLVLERILAMCFCYRGDSEWTAFLERHSVEEILCDICMIRPEEDLYARLTDLTVKMGMTEEKTAFEKRGGEETYDRKTV